MWLFLETHGGSQNVGVLLHYGAKYGPAIADGEYWRLLSAMFIHIGLFHLVANLIGLLIFGGMVERAYGLRAYVAIYFLTGIIGNVASFSAGPTVSAGASGAVFGVVAAFAAYLLVNRHVLGDLARRSLGGVALIVVLNLVFGFSVGGVDNWAHLGGLTSGLVLGFALTPRMAWATAPQDPAAPYVSYRPLVVATRRVTFGRLSSVVLATVAALSFSTWFVAHDYPYAPQEIAATSVTQAERAIQNGDYRPAAELVAAMASQSRSGTRLGLLYLKDGLDNASAGNRRRAVSSITLAYRYDLPDDAVRLADAALTRLGATR